MKIKINEEHLGGDSTKTQAVAMITKLRSRGYDVEYGRSLNDEIPEEIPEEEFRDVLSEVLNEIPDDMQELPMSFNASSISCYRK